MELPKRLKLTIVPDKSGLTEVPTVFVNYAEARINEEEACITFFLRMDQCLEIDGEEAKVPARPIQNLVMTTAHARRLVEALAGQLAQLPKEQESLLS